MGFQEFYEKYAAADFLQVDSKKVRSLALKFLRSPVLDAGCYFGEKTSFLSKHFDEVDGCDISKTAIKEARKRHKNLHFFECDLEGKNIKLEKKYNSIFAIEVIEHLFDTGQFLKNCYNNLNKGGILFLTTPNLISLLNRIRLLLGDETPFSGDKAHIRFFSPKTLREELKKAGFELIFLEGYTVRPVLKKMPMSANFSGGIIAAAKKKS